MPDKPPVTVTLTYDKDPQTGQPKVTVDPDVIKVRPGQAIHFERLGGLTGEMHVTFEDKDFFEGGHPRFAATGAFHEGDGDVRVKTIPRRTTYRCELFDANGKSIAQSKKDAGGAVELEKG
jgi:hypothetical protein